MSKVKKRACVTHECVACGACVRKCPIGAISMHKGLYAAINSEKCKGCGTCVKSCSADVMYISTEEVAQNAEKTLV